MVDMFCKYQYLSPGHEVTLAQQYAGIAVVSIPFFLLAGAGGIVFWVGTPSIHLPSYLLDFHLYGIQHTHYAPDHDPANHINHTSVE